MKGEWPLPVGLTAGPTTPQPDKAHWWNPTQPYLILGDLGDIFNTCYTWGALTVMRTSEGQPRPFLTEQNRARPPLAQLQSSWLPLLRRCKKPAARCGKEVLTMFMCLAVARCRCAFRKVACRSAVQRLWCWRRWIQYSTATLSSGLSRQTQSEYHQPRARSVPWQLYSTELSSPCHFPVIMLNFY